MDFIEFLIKAKTSGYASVGDDGFLKLDDGGLKLSYNNTDFEYEDIYNRLCPSKFWTPIYL